MKQRYLEITFQRGRALAAYLYLPRSPSASARRTTDAGNCLRVDFDAEDHPIGIEITAPGAVSVAALNNLLDSLGATPLHEEELAPLIAA